MGTPKRRKPSLIEDPLYGVFIFVVRCPRTELRTWMMRKFGKDRGNIATDTPAQATTFWMETRGWSTVVLWVAPWVTLKQIHWQGTVAHECLHVTGHVFRSRRIKLVEAAEEAQAYYLAWLYREVAQRLQR